MTHDPLELMTWLDVSRLLKVSRTTLAKWRMASRGPAAIKLGTGRGSPIRYRRVDVEAWLNSHGTGWEARQPGTGALPMPQQPTRHASDGPGVTAGLCVRRYVRRSKA